jgi:lipase ATG15
MGQCTGVSSACASGGYALESQWVPFICFLKTVLNEHTRCHLGKIIKYDTVTKLGWYSSVSHHVITALTENVLVKDWEEGKPVPDAIPESEDCVVRFFIIHVLYPF